MKKLGLLLSIWPLQIWAINNLFQDFEERSPFVEKIEFIQKERFVEVVLIGYADTKCFDKKDFLLNPKELHTEIVPRFTRTDYSKPCTGNYQEFREQAGLIDPKNPGSNIIQVLDYRGWIRQKLPQEFMPKP